MSRRVQARNAYETTLQNAISGADTTITLVSATGLITNQPGYLVLEDESPTLREYVRFESITGNTLNNVTRGLAGSVGGAGQAHGAGAIVRSVPMQQFIEDTFTDIEDLESADTVLQNNIDTHIADASDPHAAAGYLDATHVPGTDPHTQYVKKAGDTMSGQLNMGTNAVRNVADPVADPDAMPRSYADNRYLNRAGDFMAGTLDMSSQILKNVPAPTVSHHAANKSYVDAIGGGKAHLGAKITNSGDDVGEVDNAPVVWDTTEWDDATFKSGNRFVVGEGRWEMGAIVELKDAVGGTPTVAQIRLHLVGTGAVVSVRDTWVDGMQLHFDTIIDNPGPGTQDYEVRIGFDVAASVTVAGGGEFWLSNK